ncbi:MAG: cache domain-containing protein [Maricaulis sp.]|nr:cache domain-containing protein [Maricaulis sp.]
MSNDAKRHYLAAYQTVRSVGEANLDQFSSLYFFTPDRRVVIFAPNRPDRLEFYRFDAPSDFDLRGDEDADLVNLDLNPDSVMQCTRLSRYVYEDAGERAAIACRKPVRNGDDLLGSFGTSMVMDTYLSAAVEQPPAHGVNILFDRDGNLISRGQSGDAQSIADEAQINAIGLISHIDSEAASIGVFRDPGSPFLVAYAKMPRSGWYFVSIVHDRSLTQRALYWSQMLLFLVFGLSMTVAFLRGLAVQLKPFGRLRRFGAGARRDAKNTSPDPTDPEINV